MSRSTAPTATKDMPMLGLGTWQNDDPEQCAKSVRTALECGYRHVDTAQIYRNEEAVGQGIAASSVPREEIFLATKVWISNLEPDEVRRTTEESLDRLDTSYVDLLYVHWPAGDYEPEATLGAFEELRDDGLIRHVGVSNFEPTHLEAAREAIDIPILANQVELHPFLPQSELSEYCEQAAIELVAYSPLARGDVMKAEVLQRIAAKHDATPAQVSLAWLRDLGITAIPKATGEAHITDNWASLDLELDEDDHDDIAGIDRRHRTVHPDFAPEAWEQ